ncbi:outer membrane beta-barrel family protein [Mesonia aestuariivivens]|uniref:TonB-dependent receptor n=1 Tax=Mesonia aestuariivivens TaxID=2796128 RepID=A0ABS6W4N3_9FLAO|nr:outer membrane beta-barrel family protein [Mesonia aestuariivivens]MBW2962810.1 TonB-dependent receptor [Mesonia aestuariivivens]
MKQLSLFFLSLFIQQVLIAQSIALHGEVKDMLKHPVENADVILRDVQQKMITYTATDSLGKFTLKAPDGIYILEVYHLAYQKLTKNIQLVDSSPQPLGLILLSAEESLSEVMISAQKPLLEKKLDRLVINVENRSAFAGNNLFELLKNTPGIYTATDDQLQMLGKSGIRVMLNGRLQYLATNEISDFLKNIAADEIIKIELITTPPANFEAEGNAGYINIVTKKIRKKGRELKTALNGYQGKYSRIMSRTGFQYQDEQLRTDISYSYGKINSFEAIKQYNVFSNNGIIQHYRSFNQENRRTYYHTIRNQIDWQINKKSVLSFALRTMIKEEERPAENENFQLGEEDNIFHNIQSSTFEERAYINYGTDIFYEYTLDSLKKKMMLSGSYAGFSTNNQQRFSNHYFNEHEPLTQEQLRSDFKNKSEIMAFKVDFYLPFKKTTWETGLKYAQTKTNNSFLFENFDYLQWQINPNLNNDFLYREQNAALYISMQKNMAKRWKLKLGLRGEYTSTKGDSPNLDQLTTYRYFNLFSTFYLQYEVNNQYQMNLSYARRINRPDYSSLNPFITYQSPLFSNQGNPLLRPEFTHSLEWNHTLKNRYVITPFYNYTQAYYSEYPYQVEATQETRYTFGNLGSHQNAGVQAILPFKINKQINWQHSLLGLYQQYVIAYDSIQEKPAGVFWRYQSSFSVELNKNLNMEISGYYESKSIQAFYEADDHADVSIGMNYSFWKEKANLSLGVSDIFYTNRAKAEINYPNQSLGFYRRNDTRLFKIGFTYKFGKNTVKDKKSLDSASAEEQERW